MQLTKLVVGLSLALGFVATAAAQPIRNAAPSGRCLS